MRSSGRPARISQRFYSLVGGAVRLRSWRAGVASEISSLLEHGPAGRAQTGLLSPQAGGDGADVRDFAGAETIDVGRAGPSLLRRPRCGRQGAGCEQRERQSQIGAARQGPTSVKSRRHDCILSGCWRLRSAVRHEDKYGKDYSPDVIFLTLGCGLYDLRSTGGSTHW